MLCSPKSIFNPYCRNTSCSFLKIHSQEDKMLLSFTFYNTSPPPPPFSLWLVLLFLYEQTWLHIHPPHFWASPAKQMLFNFSWFLFLVNLFIVCSITDRIQFKLISWFLFKIESGWWFIACMMLGLKAPSWGSYSVVPGTIQKQNKGDVCGVAYF